MAAGTAGLVRAFIAIALEPGLTVELEKIQRQFQARISRDAVRWAKPEQLHLTLKFLGHVSRHHLADLAACLKRAPPGIAPFQLALEGAGCFPNMKNPRVVWIGINGELDSLRRLQAHVEQLTPGFGDQKEKRPFQAHLTIGRVKAHGKQAQIVGAVLEGASVPPLGHWTVGQFHLMQSDLSPEGARYTTLATVALDR